ncbi:Uncharacterized protein TCM_008453 [Theobroma cacao]|uniref:Uncharacterized protein n=1 Tax=Theobroma cacao TaxID=3641 RepID=A0A061E3X8_THECC|nr:Uncharacterized protein TCM_008453 [Theobroma cacao]
MLTTEATTFPTACFSLHIPIKSVFKASSKVALLVVGGHQQIHNFLLVYIRSNRYPRPGTHKTSTVFASSLMTKAIRLAFTTKQTLTKTNKEEW